MDDRQELYGLVVSSERPLWQARPAAAGASVDVEVRWGAPRAEPAGPPAGDPLLTYTTRRRWQDVVRRPDGGYTYRCYTAADFEINAELTSVTAHPFEGADPELSVVLLTGSVLSFMLHMRGYAVLHASAVQVRDEAIACVGFSGMGKSTVATLLCAAGGALITDDVLRVDFDEGKALARLGATELRLRKGAEALSTRFTVPPARRETVDARQVLSPPQQATDRTPLRAILIPIPDRDVEEVRLHRLSGATSVIELLRFPRLLGWQDRQVLAQLTEHAAAVASRVPVFRAQIPWGPPFADDLGSQVLNAVDAGTALART